MVVTRRMAATQPCSSIGRRLQRCPWGWLNDATRVLLDGAVLAFGVRKPPNARSDACNSLMREISCDRRLTGTQPAAAKSLTTVNSQPDPCRVFQWSRRCLAGNTSTGQENTDGHVANCPDHR